MKVSQQINNGRILCGATKRQRVRACFILLAVIGFFGLAGLGAAGKINVERWLSPCGFKQRYGLPCPTCGMTGSILSFVRGRIFEAFYIQPAGALFCCVLAIGAFLAFLTAVFGVYYEFLRRFFAGVKVRYIILVVLIIIAAGWAVTMARALTIDY